jgi:DNA-binding CsgD family transcriptional regulator
MFDYDKLVGSIYDCAANPELWPSTLEIIRDEFRAAYAGVGLVDMSPTRYQQPPVFTFLHTPWDRDRLLQLPALTPHVPGSALITDGVIDRSWTQMAQVSRAEMNETHFYKTWAGPQGLSDSLVVPYISKQQVFGMLSCALHFNQGEAFGEDVCRLAERLSPHVRRAVMINDIVDKGNLALALYRHVLDTLSTAVFVVGPGRRLVFTNASGDSILSENNFLSTGGGSLQANRTTGSVSAFDDALDRAAKGDSAIGISGIGVPLIGNDGSRAAAYVLPTSGKDLRGDLGQGHCAVFVARRGEQQPMAIEILRTLFDLTVSEARIACLIAKGDGPQAIAEALGVSVNTVRSHLQSAYAKTNAPDQLSLGALVNQLMPPVSGTA